MVIIFSSVPLPSLPPPAVADVLRFIFGVLEDDLPLLLVVVIEMVLRDELVVWMDCMLESLFVLLRVLDLDRMDMELRLPISLLLRWLVLREGERVPVVLLAALLLPLPAPPPPPCIGELGIVAGEPLFPAACICWIGLSDGERGDRRYW